MILTAPNIRTFTTITKQCARHSEHKHSVENISNNKVVFESKKCAST